MASVVTVAVSFPSSSTVPTRTSFSALDRVPFQKVSFQYRDFSISGRGVSIRAQVTTEEPVTKVVKESKKQDEGVVVNKFKPKDPYTGRCLLNTKITGDDAPGETWHMVFSTEGEVPYREGQSIGVVPDGIDKNGKPHKLRLYSIASSALGDFGDSKTVSLCVKRLVYTNDNGEVVKGVCSNFLCDLKPGNEVKITGPVGKEMLMPKDPNATIIMLATGTGIAPFRSFLWKIFFEKHEDYKFNGLAWLFLGVPTSSSLLYKEEFEKMKEKSPENFRLDFAVSREQTNEKGEKMYIQTRMAEYAQELWELLKKDNTFVYMCGLKGMEKGIDEIMVPLAAKEGADVVTIDVHAAKGLIQSGYVYLDVRTVEEFQKGHVDATKIINIPYMLSTPKGMVKNPNFVKEVSSACNKQDHFIVGCKSGVRSQYATTDLLADGFKNVKDMEGGYMEWVKNKFHVKVSSDIEEL
ncbi:hypothetical protein TanjilG_22854 [Lupinus angustifolius]|uniref:Ferredoxin--NADP reductase, chloroplastic n=1 Tax=Lupinus angustifolius TaxID=3871 RepID=A0A4P1RHU7_LUPAN|nr:hypothetical protein TanjilG_22854 [Lupinus angustifolius]